MLKDFLNNVSLKEMGELFKGKAGMCVHTRVCMGVGVCDSMGQLLLNSLPCWASLL